MNNKGNWNTGKLLRMVIFQLSKSLCWKILTVSNSWLFNAIFIWNLWKIFSSYCFFLLLIPMMLSSTFTFFAGATYSGKSLFMLDLSLWLLRGLSFQGFMWEMRSFGYSVMTWTLSSGISNSGSCCSSRVSVIFGRVSVDLLKWSSLNLGLLFILNCSLGGLLMSSLLLWWLSSLLLSRLPPFVVRPPFGTLILT